MDHLEAKHEECFYMDNKPENVEGARAVGMNAYLFSAENVPAILSAIESFVAE